MPQSLVKLLVHVIFSTKYRRDLITPEVEPDLFVYISNIVKNSDGRLLAINGTANHIHILVSLSKNMALSRLIAEIKKKTSKWIKTKGEEFKEFAWQDGYGAFSIGESAIPAIKNYIAQQKEKHNQEAYENELIAFLDKYNIDYDEKYLWD